MARGVEHEIGGQDRVTLALHFGRAGVPVKVIDAGTQARLTVPVGIALAARAFGLRVRGILGQVIASIGLPA